MKNKWYLANILTYPVIRNGAKIINQDYCIYWDNLVLISAKNSDVAYSKALKYGKGHEYDYLNSDKNRVKWKFAGVRDLVEILGPLKDLEELAYYQGFKRSFENIRKLVPKKKSLRIFREDTIHKNV